MITKSTIVALVSGILGILIGLVALINPAGIRSIPQSLGATIENFPSWFTNGIGTGAGTQVLLNHQVLTLGAGVDHVCQNNTTGRTWYVDVPSMDLIATTTGQTYINASSSFLAFVGTTTPTFCTATGFNPYLAPGAGLTLAGLSPTTSLIYLPIATSTSAATTSNSFMLSKGGVQGVVPVKDGESVIFGLVKNATTTPSACNNAASACENATSTNRGFNLRAILHILYLP